MEWTEYLNDDVYIKGVIMCIVKSLTHLCMGTDCWRKLSNCFLLHNQYLYMKNLMRNNLCMASSLVIQ